MSGSLTHVTGSPKGDMWRPLQKAIKALSQGVCVGMPTIQSNLNNGRMTQEEISIHLERIANQAKHAKLVEGRREVVGRPHQDIMRPFCQQEQQVLGCHAGLATCGKPQALPIAPEFAFNPAASSIIQRHEFFGRQMMQGGHQNPVGPRPRRVLFRGSHRELCGASGKAVRMREVPHFSPWRRRGWSPVCHGTREFPDPSLGIQLPQDLIVLGEHPIDILVGSKSRIPSDQQIGMARRHFTEDRDRMADGRFERSF